MARWSTLGDGLGRLISPGSGPLASALFFISGAAALVLESVWVRLFALSFGTTGLAMATVLTAYMAGLALGGALGGRLADRTKTPASAFLVYGAMEALIALFAIAVPSLRVVAASADGFFEGWFSGSLVWISAGRFIVSAAVLIVPTTLMGATLPILSRAVVDQSGTVKEVAKIAGQLYGINTLGAVIGAALTPFVLLPHVGVFGTCITVAIADTSVALVACTSALVARRRSRMSEKPRADRAEPAGEADNASSGGLERHTRTTSLVAVWAVGLSGAVAMVYQQVWARFLSLLIGSSVYAISLIFALFLLGLSLGSAVYARRTALRPGQTLNLAVIHGAIASWTLVVILLGDRLPAAFVVGMRLVGVSMTKVVLLQAILASTVVLIPTFFMGMTFPATLRLVGLGRPDMSTGRAVGRTYSWNTLGAIVGSFLGGFVVLPALGTQGSLVGCAVASIALGVIYAGLTWVVVGWKRALSPLVFVGCVCLALFSFQRPWNLSVISSGVFRVSRSAELAESLTASPHREATERNVESSALRPWIERSREGLRPRDLWFNGFATEEHPPDLVFHQAGLTATVAVTESRMRSWIEGHEWLTYSLRVNGKADASLTVISGLPPSHPSAISPHGDAETQIMSGILPFLLHRGDPETVLVVGWGSGLTVGATLDTGVERVRVVEIEAQVIEGSAPFQPYAGWPLRSPRLDVVEDDGRRLLSAREDQYDIIVSEPSNPWISGCSNLFTAEFFDTVSSRLNEGGRFLQWVQAYEISPSTLTSILAALRQAFPSVVIYQPAHSPSDLLIVAGNDEIEVDWESVSERMSAADVARWLRRFGVLGPEDIAARLVFDTARIDALTAHAIPNTDDNLLVELAAPFDLVQYRDESARRLLRRFGAYDEPPRSVFTNLPTDLNERLDSALIRSGRRSEAYAIDESSEAELWLASPTMEQVRLFDLDTPDFRDLEELAATLPLEDGPLRELAALGAMAHRVGEYDLAALFLTAHAVSARPPLPRAVDLLSYYCWELGLSARAWAFKQEMERTRRLGNDSFRIREVE